MEDSREDVFSDVLYDDDLENVRLSRYTIYHSAPDFDEIMTERTILCQENGNTVTVDENDGPRVRIKSTMFRDGRRTVDFVLAWLENKNSSQYEPKRIAFEKRLENEGLQLEKEVTERLHVVKLHAPNSVLKRYCEILKLRLPMKQIPGQEEPFRTEFDLMTDVKSFFSKLMSCVRLNPNIFPPQTFHLSAEYSRNKSYLFDDENPNFFTPQVRTIVVDFILERTGFSSETNSISEVGIQKLINDGVYSAAYPLHDGSYDDPDCLRGLLLQEWALISKWAMYQPIDQIREYFGVKFALYFAWLGFYTHMLVPASIVGILCFLYGCFTIYTDKISDDICNKSLNITMCPLCDRTCDYWKLADTCTYAKFTYLFDNPATIIFAIFMSFWATLFLELWKRYSASIAHRWGLSDFCLQSEPPRPNYLAKVSENKKAKLRTNLITGTKEPYVSFWEVRLPATLLSFSVVFVLVAIAVAAVFGVVFYRMSVLASISLIDPVWAANYALFFIPVTAAIINLCFILVLNWFYDKVAVYLTEMELLRTQTEFDESLTIKIYLFQFVNYYASIMYIAFLKGKFVGYPKKYNRIFGFRQEECNPGGCLMELCIQLAIIMIGKQAMDSVVEMLLPLLYKWLNAFKLTTGIKKKCESQDVMDPTHKRWTADYKLLDYGSMGLFYEYLEMVIQYGFVTIFVSAFPLAPFFALLNNVLEMRLDAKKFLMYYRRPVPRRAPNIGVWFRILNVLGRLAVISNAFIIAFSSNFIPRLVYKMSVSPTKDDEGFILHSLSIFNTSDFPPDLAPINSSFDPLPITCRYAAYRAPPGAQLEYKKTSLHWHVLAARLAFIVIFQNVVLVVVTAVQWCITDVSPKLKDQIKHEAYLTSELIIQHEALQVKKYKDDSKNASKEFVNAEREKNLKKRNSGDVIELERL